MLKNNISSHNHHRWDHDSPPNLIPLLDFLLVLLIVFVLLASRIQPIASVIKVNLPAVPAQTHSVSSTQNSLTITVLPQEQYFINETRYSNWESFKNALIRIYQPSTHAPLYLTVDQQTSITAFLKVMSLAHELDIPTANIRVKNNP